MFKDLCNETIRFNEEYSTFAGAPEGAKTSVRYIFKVETPDTRKSDNKKSEDKKADDSKADDSKADSSESESSEK
ncbi:hypothetical protein [Allobaculum sp. Allo2]|nr:hypothetical protein [Allobaculum sp. Allo2]UNT93450.1 hypothetical protein KWG61_01085 [Allobaculum sp. Allo2]